jgi:hypothetical protein
MKVRIPEKRGLCVALGIPPPEGVRAPGARRDLIL